MKRVLCLMACLIMLVGMIPARASAEEQRFDRYGYAHLENDPQRYVYEMLVPCIAEHGEKVTLDPNMQVKVEDAKTAIQMIIRDYPEFFWFYQEQFTYGYDPSRDNALTSITPKYKLHESVISYSDPKLDQAISAFNAKVDAMVSAIPSTKITHYEKALYLHDALAAAVEYVDTHNDQTAYGALVEGEAVCAGYTRAYQCLLKKVGIDSWYVTGQSLNPQGNPEDHAWNLVLIYDDLNSSYQCLYTDVTWDDQKNTLFHMYFNCGGEEFLDSHFPDDFSKKYLPGCDHDGHDYFARSHGEGSGVYDHMTDSTTAAQAAYNFGPMSMKDGVGTRTLDIYFSGSSFETWIQNHITELGAELGFVGRFSYSYSKLGAEYRLSVSGTPAVPTVEAESISLDMTRLDFTRKGETYTLKATIAPADTTDQTITFSSQNPAVASVDPATGVVTAVGGGTTNITATTANGKTASCLVQVTISAPSSASIGVESGKAYLEDGTAAEKATAGTYIIIRADEAPEGMEFDYWSITIGAGVVLADPGKAETSFAMPPQGAVLLKANYRPKTVHVTGVSLDVTEILLPFAGATAKLNASIQPADATVRKLIWVSKDPNVVTVKDGELTAVAPGTAEVTVTTQDGGFLATCYVTVTAHVHDETLRAVEEKKPTCTENGYGAHFECASCGLWFEDAEGQAPLTDHNKILLKATGHSPSEWCSNEEHHWKTCTVEGCGAEIEGSRKAHADEDQDATCDVCRAKVDTIAPTDATESSEETKSETTPTEPQTTQPGAEEKDSDPSWIIWLVICLVLAAGAVAAWFFLRKRK